MRYLTLSFLVILTFGLSATCINAIELKNDILVCSKEECKTIEKNYSFKKLDIRTSFKEIYPDYIDKVNFAYYVSIIIYKNNSVLWQYNEGLDAYGDMNVGISQVSISPNEYAMAISVVGNYLYKIILIDTYHNVKIINAGPFKWEQKSKYLFSTITEDTPVGFLIYDLYQKKTIFKTDKLIIDWKLVDNAKYILVEAPNLLEGNSQKKNYYNIDLSSNTPKLRSIKRGNRGQRPIKSSKGKEWKKGTFYLIEKLDTILQRYDDCWWRCQNLPSPLFSKEGHSRTGNGG